MDIKTTQDECLACHTEGDKYKVCGRCKIATYCSRDCQTNHWKVHKNGCNLMKKLDLGFSNQDPEMSSLFEYGCSLVTIQEEKTHFRIVDIEGKGKGVVATKPFTFGELIIQEEAVLLSNLHHYNRSFGFGFRQGRDILTKMSKSPEEVTHREQEWISFQNIYLKTILDGLSEGKQKSVMALHDLFPVNGKTTLLGIVASNAFGDDPNFSEILHLNISRLNHSCLPNVEYKYDAPFGRVYATKEIDKGEELNISYTVEIRRNITEQREHLQDVFRFNCECEMCSDDSKKIRDIQVARLRFKELDNLIQKTLDAKKKESLIKERFTVMKRAELYYPSYIAVHAMESLGVALDLNNSKAIRDNSELVYRMSSIRRGEEHEVTKEFKNRLDMVTMFR